MEFAPKMERKPGFFSHVISKKIKKTEICRNLQKKNAFSKVTKLFPFFHFSMVIRVFKHFLFTYYLFTSYSKFKNPIKQKLGNIKNKRKCKKSVFFIAEKKK